MISLASTNISADGTGVQKKKERKKNSPDTLILGV
jgi:hypothetical protein